MSDLMISQCSKWWLDKIAEGIGQQAAIRACWKEFSLSDIEDCVDAVKAWRQNMQWIRIRPPADNATRQKVEAATKLLFRNRQETFEIAIANYVKLKMKLIDPAKFDQKISDISLENDVYEMMRKQGEDIRTKSLDQVTPWHPIMVDAGIIMAVLCDHESPRSKDIRRFLLNLPEYSRVCTTSIEYLDACSAILSVEDYPKDEKLIVDMGKERVAALDTVFTKSGIEIIPCTEESVRGALSIRRSETSSHKEALFAYECFKEKPRNIQVVALKDGCLRECWMSGLDCFASRKDIQDVQANILPPLENRRVYTTGKQ